MDRGSIFCGSTVVDSAGGSFSGESAAARVDRVRRVNDLDGLEQQARRPRRSMYFGQAEDTSVGELTAFGSEDEDSSCAPSSGEDSSGDSSEDSSTDEDDDEDDSDDDSDEGFNSSEDDRLTFHEQLEAEENSMFIAAETEDEDEDEDEDDDDEEDEGKDEDEEDEDKDEDEDEDEKDDDNVKSDEDGAEADIESTDFIHNLRPYSQELPDYENPLLPLHSSFQAEPKMFTRLIRDISLDLKTDLWFTDGAIGALAVAADDFLQQIFSITAIFLGDDEAVVKPTDLLAAAKIRQLVLDSKDIKAAGSGGDIPRYDRIPTLAERYLIDHRDHNRNLAAEEKIKKLRQSLESLSDSKSRNEAQLARALESIEDLKAARQHAEHARDIAEESRKRAERERDQALGDLAEQNTLKENKRQKV